MSRRTITLLLLAALAAGLVFTVGFRATRSVPLRSGMTVSEPAVYFLQQVRADREPRRLFRSVTCVSPASGVWVYSTGFVVPGGREIATRISTYRFDTNGIVLTVSSHWKWPFFDF